MYLPPTYGLTMLKRKLFNLKQEEGESALEFFKSLSNHVDLVYTDQTNQMDLPDSSFKWMLVELHWEQPQRIVRASELDRWFATNFGRYPLELTELKMVQIGK
uniref:Retrotransposon gag domain-containing protein n=1 Tax=Romanomermis culicivorax TaxID=13658 RepID=A0A915JAU9_ROMCU